MGNSMMEATEENQGPVVPAVSRVLDILEYIAEVRRPVTSREIADRLDIPPTSVFRLVKQLALRGYLEEDVGKPGCYQLGLQILALSGAVLQANDLRGLALPEMQKLAGDTGQTVQLGVLRGNQVMYIEQVLPTNAVGIVAPLYSILPINVSAAGKMIVSQLPESALLPLIEGLEFVKRTEKTISDRAELFQALLAVQKQGYARDDEEFSQGVGCLAAPIYDYSGACVASLCITGHIHDYRDVCPGEGLLQALMQAAERISHKLGRRPG